MILSRAQLEYAQGLAQVYGSAHLGDQDQDGAVLLAPPLEVAGADEAARWVRPDGSTDEEPAAQISAAQAAQPRPAWWPSGEQKARAQAAHEARLAEQAREEGAR